MSTNHIQRFMAENNLEIDYVFTPSFDGKFGKAFYYFDKDYQIRDTTGELDNTYLTGLLTGAYKVVLLKCEESPLILNPKSTPDDQCCLVPKAGSGGGYSQSLEYATQNRPVTAKEMYDFVEIAIRNAKIHHGLNDLTEQARRCCCGL